MPNTQKDTLLIKTAIESNKPFFIGRIAGCELKVAHLFLKGDTLEIADELYRLENNAGIFTENNSSLKAYVQKLVESYDHCTVIAEWETDGSVFTFTGIGQQLITSRTPHTPKINARALEPYYYKEKDSWMPALKGKRILIVHPFVNTFQKQVTNLHKIFPGRQWFTDCTFQIIAPPVTLAGNHGGVDWQEHYRKFTDSLRELKEFDVALVAAGGYGMLIADHIFTELNRSVIYVGGALQLFFGVVGKRWFNSKEIMNLVNDDWIRPDKEDKPPKFIMVERGCYW